MGNFRSVPVTTKDTVVGEGNGLVFGVTGMEGYRKGMEDAHCAVCTLPKCGLSFFGVFDGHSGTEAAVKAAAALPDLVDAALQHADPTDTAAVSAILREVCLKFDRGLDLDDMSGCTAVMALVTKQHIVVANVGDSRAVLATDGGAVPLSKDHKPDNPSESKRVEAAGGMVVQGRVDGQLAVSRAFGDFRFKYAADRPATEQPVSPEPEIRVHARDAATEFLILACDGVWDVMSNEDAVHFIHDCVSSDMGSWGEVCEAVVDNALELGSRDNMTICIVGFPEAGPKMAAKVPAAATTATDDANPSAAGARAAPAAAAAPAPAATTAGAGAVEEAKDSGDADAAATSDGGDAARASATNASSIASWAEKLAELQMTDKYAPHIREARTKASSRAVVALDGSADVAVVPVEVDVADGKTFPPDAELNELVSLWGGMEQGKRGGDILRLEADAIVVPANGQLLGSGGGLYGRVHRLGGPRIRKDLASRFEELSPGEVAVTSGFNLPAYNVIHAVVLHADDVESTVDACVRRALNSAKDRGFRTVAFPALGATEAGTTMVKCVDTLVRGVRTFLEEGANREVFDTIVFCAFKAEVEEAFENVMRRVFPATAKPSTAPRPASPEQADDGDAGDDAGEGADATDTGAGGGTSAGAGAGAGAGAASAAEPAAEASSGDAEPVDDGDEETDGNPGGQ